MRTSHKSSHIEVPGGAVFILLTFVFCVDWARCASASRMLVYDYCECPNGPFNIFTMNGDSGIRKQITFENNPNRHASYPAWSPDGARIVWGEWNGSLVFSDADGDNRKNVPLDGLTTPSYLTWSPDGKRVAFVAWEAAIHGIYVLDVPTKAVRNIHTSRFALESLSWGPDSNRILFASVDPHDIFIIHVANGNLENITNTGLARQEWLPAWSPDGEELAYVENDALWLLTLQTGVRTKVPTMALRDFVNPSWSSDGEQIVFGTREGDGGGVYGVFPDGNDFRRILNTPKGISLQARLFNSDLSVAPGGKKSLTWSDAKCLRLE